MGEKGQFTNCTCFSFNKYRFSYLKRVIGYLPFRVYIDNDV